MATKATILYGNTLFLLLSAISVAISANVHPFLQNQKKHTFHSPYFSRIYDTSNYGILQLNNGLARTPQMGFVSYSYLFLLSFWITIACGFSEICRLFALSLPTIRDLS